MEYKSLLDVSIINDKTVDEFEGVKKYVATGDIQDNKIISYDEVTYDSKPSRANREVEIGDILVARMKETVKVFKITEENYDKYIFSTGFCTLKSNNGVLDSDYFYKILISEYFQEQKDKYSKGATQKAINNTGLKKIKIPVPQINIQKQIVEVLEEAQSLIDNRKIQVKLLDDLIESIFYDMFGDPVLNVKEWEIRNLKEFYKDGKKSIKCGPFGSALKKAEYKTQGVPVWAMDNIVDSRFVDVPLLYIDEDKYSELGTYSVVHGDIIISRAGTVGKMCEVKTEYRNSIISTNLIRLRLNDLLLPLYFVSLMTYFGTRICTLRTGQEGAFSHMNTGILNSIDFPYPPIDIQKDFVRKVQIIEEEKQLMKKSLIELEHNYNNLMQRAFKGHLF